MKKVFVLLLSVLFFISIHQVMAQDPYARLKQTAAQSPVIKRVLAKTELAESDKRLKVSQKAPIAFRQFDMVDLKGRKIDPNETTIINGKQITAREFFARLNEIEKEQNAKGYSIRGDKSALVVDIVTPASELDGKVPEMSMKIAPLKSENDLKSLSPNSKQIGSLTLNPFGQYSDAEKKKLAETKFSVDPSGTLAASTNSNSIKNRRSNLTAVTGSNKNTTLTTGNNTTSGALKVISDLTTKEWSLGIMSTVKAGVRANLLRSAKIYPYNPQSPGSSMSEFKVKADASVFGGILNNSLDLLSAGVELFAPSDSSKPMTVKEQIQLAGFTVINTTENLTQSKTFGKSQARDIDNSFPIKIPICCGVGFVGKIGVKGSVGLNYNCAIFRTVVRLQAEPVIELKGYAEGGASVAGIANVGVGAEINFIQGHIPLNSYVGIWAQNADQVIVGYNYYMGYDLSLLGGRLYGYAEVCCPWVGCHRLGEVNFIKWDGFKASGTIAEGGSNYVLNNL
jgi:hypothetical protein